MKLEYYLDYCKKEDFFCRNTSFKDKVLFYDGSVELADYNVAILGVPEDRNSVNKGSARSPKKIRKFLYEYASFSLNLKVVDLGDIKQGKTVNDTFVGLKDIVSFLLEKGLSIVFIGGSQDLSIPIAESLIENKSDETVITSIDAKLNYGTIDEINSTSIWASVQKKHPKVKINCIASQQYVNTLADVEAWENSCNRNIRLGKIRKEIMKVEPILRDSDFVSFDISSVRYSDSPNKVFNNPNGLYAEEACQLAWYSGMSDRGVAFGIFETNTENCSDISEQLSAQIIWHYLEGYTQRKHDFPFSDIDSYKTYYVTSEDLSNEIIFYESPKSKRWWMRIILNEDTSYIVSCNYDDYLVACDNKIPDLWFEEMNRLKHIYK